MCESTGTAGWHTGAGATGTGLMRTRRGVQGGSLVRTRRVGVQRSAGSHLQAVRAARAAHRRAVVACTEDKRAEHMREVRDYAHRTMSPRPSGGSAATVAATAETPGSAAKETPTCRAPSR